MRSVIIGDVHGCYREMMEILSQIGPSTSDQIYFTGDLINKGPDSEKVIREVYRNGYQSVLGNHEWSYLKRLSARRVSTPFSSQLLLKKNPLLDKLINSLTEEENYWITNLPFYIDTPNFLLVHAGIFPNRSLPNHNPCEILNVRTINNRPWHDEYCETKKVIYGHWAVQGLKIKKNSIGLDSGCVYGKTLSAFILPEEKIVQVSSQTCVL